MKKLGFLLILIAVLLSGCREESFKSPTIKIITDYGNIYVQLFPDKAPQTVAGFLKFVEAGYFKNTSFYRVLKKEDQPSNAFKSQIIQGGLWESNYKMQETLPGIPHESTKMTGLSHTDGVISLARDKVGSANTEFFICIGNQHVYDYGGEASNDGEGFAAFGTVVKGMAVVKKINSLPDIKAHLAHPVKIKNIVLLK